MGGCGSVGCLGRTGGGNRCCFCAERLKTWPCAQCRLRARRITQCASSGVSPGVCLRSKGPLAHPPRNHWTKVAKPCLKRNPTNKLGKNNAALSIFFLPSLRTLYRTTVTLVESIPRPALSTLSKDHESGAVYEPAQAATPNPLTHVTLTLPL